MAESDLKKNYCIGCGRLLSTKEFAPNPNRWHKKFSMGLMNYCKSCTKDMAQDMLKEFWAVGKNADDRFAYKLGIRTICQYFDMPYISEVADEMYIKQTNVTRPRDLNLVTQYQQILKEMNITDDKYDNLVGNSVLCYDLMPDTLDHNNVSLTSSGDVELMNELEYVWGVHSDLSDYIFLEERYHTYTAGETLTPAVLNMIKYLCMSELDLKHLRKEHGEQKEITTCEKRITDYYAKLGFDKVKFNQNKSEIEYFIEDWGNTFENKEPLDWVDEHLEDICGFREDNDHIMRALGNKVLGTKDYPSLTSDDLQETKKKVKAKNGKSTTTA